MESEAEANTVIPLQSHDVQSDAESTTRVNPPLDIGFFTPTKSTSIPTCDSFYTPDCDESITPTIGMYFSDVNTAKEFYEVYAHHVGFSVRVGQHKSSNGVMTHKRFMYAKEGFREETGVNHHKGSILFGAAFLHDEKVASFVWLFQTFLKAMEGVEPTLMITDECASMISALHTVFPTTTHRLCMWHIMKKVGEKVSPDLKSNEYFHDHLNLVVWASETPSEFEERWSHVIEEFGLEENEWFTKRFELRESWIPAYFNDIALSGLLRTTSRSESANAFFSRIIGYKHAFVEFWLRFETALEEQRHKELEDDNVSLHTSPPLKTSWGLEKHGSIVFTHEVFTEFQKELLADREHNTR
ncbi:protein FAR-RED IMPAIRED RESPONSE 1 isoform X2 [Triticum aestivum]|uniref:protein FAR-RED IMPAIRED RESPONSE 1 isoform X2 n=1 Tax=Triticum aestivum TaxID=4565 RepID=UPI001D00906B|nr:protein FAR-RED IMPAIRED RESPONSE 1-like isoform X2 [Triticum aestivum]